VIMEGITLAEGFHDGGKHATPFFQVYPDICLTPEESYSKP
jgi:hypothetical protein